jgi:hypothetical protein
MLDKALATLWTPPSSSLMLFEAYPAPAHPACPLRRSTHHQGIRGDVAGHDRAGPDCGIGADRQAGEDCGPRAETGASLHTSSDPPSRLLSVSCQDRRQRHPRTSREHVVHKADTRTDEDVVTNLDAVPHHRLVFDSYAVANARARFDESVVADIAIAPDHGALHDVRKGPYPRTSAYLLAFAQRTGMNEDVGCRQHGP